MTAYTSFIFDIIGCTGAVIILITYFLNQCDVISTANLSYSLLNLAGAVLILVSLTASWNLASVIMEIFWIAISLFGAIKWWKSSSVS